MIRISRFLVLLLLGLSTHMASAFVLRGPARAYQTETLGYDGTLSYPQTLNEEYRWNIPVITYGFDAAFLNYFGTNGVRAIEQAFRVFNDFPPSSLISDQVLTANYGFKASDLNVQANALQVIDIKSLTMTCISECMGLLQPESYIYALRSRTTPPNQTNYSVIWWNIDPITIRPTNAINGITYTYQIVEGLLGQGTTGVTPVPLIASTTATGPSILVQGIQAVPINGLAAVNSDNFFYGLTFDDAGAIRYLYATNNFNTEGLLPGVTLASSAAVQNNVGGVWNPVVVGVVTNVVTTNVLGGAVDVAVRMGANKVRFVRMNYDSLLGQTFIATTNVFIDNYVTNGVIRSQTLQRAITGFPDILFSAGDLDVNGGGNPLIYEKVNYLDNESNAWLNNGTGPSLLINGPGVFIPGIGLNFTTLLPSYFNSTPIQVGPDVPFWGVFGYYDSTQIYDLFPSYLNLQVSDLEQVVVQTQGQ
jgi:hypothetical protein